MIFRNPLTHSTFPYRARQDIQAALSDTANTLAHEKEIRRFVIGLTLIFLGLSIWLYYKGQSLFYWPILLALSRWLLYFSNQNLIKKAYTLWMRGARSIGWINTQILLRLIYYLVLTPVGLGVRLLRKDLLNMKFDRKNESYWQERPRVLEPGIENYEKQF